MQLHTKKNRDFNNRDFIDLGNRIIPKAERLDTELTQLLISAKEAIDKLRDAFRLFRSERNYYAEHEAATKEARELISKIEMRLDELQYGQH